MKKTFALALALVMVLGMLVGCGGSGGGTEPAAQPATTQPATGTAQPAAQPAAPAASDPMADLIAAAKAEGELVVYGSCEEDYLAAACANFEKLYGIKTQYQRLSTGEVPTKIEEENGNPSADVWFGGTNNPYDTAAAKDLLDNSYTPINASHLTKDIYKDPSGYWYGIYTGILGFMANKGELDRLGLAAPQTWDDLLKPEYKGLIWLSNYNTAGTAKLVINTMLQMKGHDEGIKYLVELDKNIQVYTKSGSGPSKNVGTGECVIGIGFLHDGITQIVDNGYDNVQLIIPADGTSCEIGPVAIFKGAKHMAAAKLFMEYALSPDCVELAANNGSYQFLVIDNAQQPQQAIDFGLDPSLVWDGYDFADAAANTATYVEEVMAALNGGDDRFKTE
ncbi:MAG: ABC transporter substrate-binding protein [Ruminococcaceae bacterium]|nr:ABC transporter substrate-binding protein [Oscillospiraceae bacterium]